MSFKESRFGDISSGPFEVIYTSPRSSNYEYSLVRVYDDEPFLVMYDKKSLNIRINLEPLNFFWWKAEGSVDNDTIYNLGLPVKEKRRGKEAPIIGDYEVDEIKERGQIEKIDEFLWKIDLALPVNNIYHFFAQVWNPQVGKREEGGMVEKIHLGSQSMGFRILPQKRFLSEGDERSYLLVLPKEQADSNSSP